MHFRETESHAEILRNGWPKSASRHTVGPMPCRPTRFHEGKCQSTHLPPQPAYRKERVAPARHALKLRRQRRLSWPPWLLNSFMMTTGRKMRSGGELRRAPAI